MGVQWSTTDVAVQHKPRAGREKLLLASARRCSEGDKHHDQPPLWSATAPESRPRGAAGPVPTRVERRAEENRRCCSPGGQRRGGSPSLGPEDDATFKPWTLSRPMKELHGAGGRGHECNGSATAVLRTHRYVHFKIRAQKYVKSVFHEHSQPVPIDHRLFAKKMSAKGHKREGKAFISYTDSRLWQVSVGGRRATALLENGVCAAVTPRDAQTREDAHSHPSAAGLPAEGHHPPLSTSYAPHPAVSHTCAAAHTCRVHGRTAGLRGAK